MDYFGLLAISVLFFGIGYLTKGCKDVNKLKELADWLIGEKFLIDENSTTMTEEFEKEHSYQLGTNITINRTKKQIDNIFYN